MWLVLLGGEAVTEAVWSRLSDPAGPTGYNLYGPTEYTINTLGAGTADSTTPTVGKPIFNTRATSWTPGCGRSRPASSASCTSPAPAWPAATCTPPGLTASRFVAAPARQPALPHR